MLQTRHGIAISFVHLNGNLEDTDAGRYLTVLVLTLQYHLSMGTVLLRYNEEQTLLYQLVDTFIPR